ncbi:MAG: hypothetical protein Q4C63_08675 [Eubacteriales bacterium]|nr:hypothetical protein [Eubacteriales bacterium]
MKTYKVVFLRRGYALIEANTEEEAGQKARQLRADQLHWSEDDLFFPAYIQVAEEKERNI